MSNFTKEMLDKYALDLLFKLTDSENETLLKEFDSIERSMELINNIPNIKSVEPLTHPFELTDVSLREDVSEESISVDEAFKNSGKINGREVEVPRVVG